MGGRRFLSRVNFLCWLREKVSNEDIINSKIMYRSHSLFKSKGNGHLQCQYRLFCISVPDMAKVKSWPVVEINGWIYLWYHAEGKDPTWQLPEIEDIAKGNWVYRGRTEHIINAHIEVGSRWHVERIKGSGPHWIEQTDERIEFSVFPRGGERKTDRQKDTDRNTQTDRQRLEDRDRER